MDDKQNRKEKLKALLAKNEKSESHCVCAFNPVFSMHLSFWQLFTAVQSFYRLSTALQPAWQIPVHLVNHMMIHKIQRVEQNENDSKGVTTPHHCGTVGCLSTAPVALIFLRFPLPD